MKRSFITLCTLAAVAFFAAACSERSEQTLTPQAEHYPGTDWDLHPPGDQTVINGATWQYPVPFNVGTGQINPFLSVQADNVEECFNSNEQSEDCKRYPNFTQDLPLNHVPVIVEGGVTMREFILDANEANSGVDAQFAIQFFDVWLCDDPDAPNFDEEEDFENNPDCAEVYNIDGAIGDATDEVTSGSGLDLDYRILIPEDMFEDAAVIVAGGAPQGQQLIDDCPYLGPDSDPCGVFLVFHVRFGDLVNTDWEVGSTFEEMSTINRGFVTVAKTATTSLTRTHDWDIEKSVDPTSLTMFPGQSGDADYTVEVIYNGSVDSDWHVEGTITIENPSEDTVRVQSVTDAISGFGGTVTVSCPGGLPQLLDEDETLVCTYEADLPDGTNRTNTATVALTSGGVTQANADVDFSTATVTEIDEHAEITDNVEGDLGSADAPSEPTFEYSRTFTCNEDEGQHDNTATITATDTDTEDSDDASVVVNCEAITVAKTAVTTFSRTWTWTIEKTIDPSCFLAGTFDAGTGTATVSESESLDVCYDITVNASSEDSDWAVSGTITIHNNHPSQAAALTSVTDAMTGGITGTVVCPSLNVPASGDLVCTYSADLPNASARTNTATATLFGEEYTGDAAVSFDSTPDEETDECINVKDYFNGDAAGEVVDAEYCAADGVPHTFQDFTETVTPEMVECGENVIPNVAKFVTNDTDTEGEDDAPLNVVVECEEGCTLTLGYWKTHNETFPGGAPPDPTWDLLPGGLAENTIFFLSGDTWYEVFWTKPGGNVYYQLAWQYMAAKLNVLAGATPPANVATAIAHAETLFNTYTPAQIGALKGNQPPRPDFVATAGILADFNEGDIGPGHCTENVESIF